MIVLTENAASNAADGDPLPVPLTFHQRCGSRAAVMGPDMRTAHRPHAMEDFNNGVVLSNRILLPDEKFEVGQGYEPPSPTYTTLTSTTTAKQQPQKPQ